MSTRFYAFSTALLMAGSVFSQELHWARLMGSFAVDQGSAVASDAAGNVYSTGFFASSTDLDPGPATATFGSAGNYDTYIHKLDPQGNYVWAKQIGSMMDEVPRALEIDASGNVYVAGHFNGTPDFDPGPGDLQIPTAGSQDIYIVKLDPDGNLIWVKTIGSTSGDTPSDLALDASGNVYVTGLFSGTVDFDPGAGTTSLTSTNNNYFEGFVLKLDGAGNFGWVKQIGGPEDESPRSIDIDAAGNVYTSGYFYGTVDFDPGAGTTSLVSNGGSDIFLQKLDASGNFAWARQWGSAGNESAGEVNAGVAGAVFFTGTYTDPIDLDPGAATQQTASFGQSDAFVLKMTSAGDYTWGHAFGGPAIETGYSLVTDADGAVYTTGYYATGADLDPGAGTFTPDGSPVGYATYVQKLDANGNFVLAGTIAPNIGMYTNSIALASDGGILLTGSLSGSADFAPGSDEFPMTAVGNQDIYVVKWSGEPLAVTENELSVLSAWPNPSQGSVTVSLGISTETLKATVMDLSGKMLSTTTANDCNGLSFDLPETSGVYFIQLRDGNGREATVKVIRE